MGKRATKPVNNDMLTCPKCGSQRFERVMAGFSYVQPFTMEKPYMPAFSNDGRYLVFMNGRDTIQLDKHFRCAKCGHVLRDKYRHKISTETGLLTYLQKQQ